MRDNKYTPFDFWVLRAPEQEKVHYSLRISERFFHPLSRHTEQTPENKSVARFLPYSYGSRHYPSSWRQITWWKKSQPRERPRVMIGSFLHSQSAAFLRSEEQNWHLCNTVGLHRRRNGELCLTRTLFCAFVFVSCKNVLLQTGHHRPWNTWSRIGHERSCFVYN